MISEEQVTKLVNGVEKLGNAAEQLSQVVGPVKQIIDAAGGVEGVKRHIDFLKTFLPKPKPAPKN